MHSVKGNIDWRDQEAKSNFFFEDMGSKNPNHPLPTKKNQNAYTEYLYCKFLIYILYAYIVMGELPETREEPTNHS